MSETSAGPVQVPGHTVTRYYRIDRRQIHFMKFVLEGYDGVAVLRTMDAQKGLVVVHIAPGVQDVVDMVVADLQASVRIEPVEM